MLEQRDGAVQFYFQLPFRMVIYDNYYKQIAVLFTDILTLLQIINTLWLQTWEDNACVSETTFFLKTWAGFYMLQDNKNWTEHK